MKILFIGPRFYSYHIAIQKAFENKGHSVTYFDDRPGTDFLTKAIIRFNKKLLKRKISKYFKKILDSAMTNKYDLVFVIYGQCLEASNIRELKKVLPYAKYVFYMYDPISSMPDRLEFSKEFDVKFSFDTEDVKKYPDFRLLPLFYSKSDFPNNDIEYDVCFIGTMMPGKYHVVNSILNDFKENGFKTYSYQYIQSKVVALLYKLFYKDFRGCKLRELKTKRITQEEVNTIISKSRYVIDCPKQNQTGLTIRIFETMFAKKKIITSNESIVDYPFYSRNNFYIYKNQKIDFEDSFFKTSFMEIDNKILERYEINNWINIFLEDI